MFFLFRAHVKSPTNEEIIFEKTTLRMQEREYRTMKDELEKTKAKFSSLGSKLSDEERKKFEEALRINFSSSNSDYALP
jgi:hypothetical protein